MKRSLSGLLIALALTACKEEPRGKMEPIAPPPAAEPAAGSSATAKATPPAEGAVLLRWKLAKGEPRSYRLSLASDGAAPAEAEAPEPEPKNARDAKKKGRGAKEKDDAPAPAAAGPTELTYLLDRTNSGDILLRVTPSGGGAPDEATLSDRGFVLEGLQGPARNLATLALELPRDTVRVGDTWSLGTELVVPDVFGASFRRKAGERRNRVKLTALTPAEGGEQVATLEYDLLDQLAGAVPGDYKPPTAPEAKAKTKAAENEDARRVNVQEVAASVRITVRGEFLVKAGHWRSWEGTVVSTTMGPARAAVQLPLGTLKARLVPLDSAPAPAPVPVAPPATPQPPAAEQPAP